MNISKTLYVTERSDWRKWLKQNYQTEKEIWLIYYNKDSGKPRIPYDDAVEEALCFGWIDSIVKKINKESFAQKFSPRKPKSSFSQLNKERLKRLIKLKKVIKSVKSSLGEIENEQFVIPTDILNEIKKNKKAWINFQEFSEPYKRIRVAFIDGARKRPDEFRKRLKYFIKKTEANQKYGISGIEKFY
jgi:uncharacterized protein YdeI (YjbR/CyaY-like superfamily)